MDSRTRKRAAIVAAAVQTEPAPGAEETGGPEFYRATRLVHAAGRLWKAGEVRPSVAKLAPPLWQRLENPTDQTQ